MSLTVRFLPENRTWVGAEPTDLFMAAATCDILLEQPCGSKLVCGKCRVRVADGELCAGAADVRVLGAHAVAEGWRLGCQLVLDANAVIEVPSQTRTVAAKSFGDDALFAAGFTPAVRRVRVSVPEPDETRQHAALTLLAGQLETTEAALAPSVAALRSLSDALKRSNDVVAVLAEGRLRHVEAARAATATAGYGFAIDVGSTTLAAALVDLTSGQVVGTASQVNPQVRFGGDIISRIHWAQEHPADAGQLHETLVQTLNALIAQCSEGAHVRREQVDAVAAVGNPTMLHTLLGLDVTPLGQAPYVGLLQSAWRGGARAIGLELPAWASVYVLPGVRSHVGADTVAALLAEGVDASAQPRLLIDLGTNSEVAIGCRDFVVCTSTSAGPAFEGANIHHGMRAAPGAIDQVRVRPTGSIMVRTIGGEAAVGVCGSGLIDAVAELVRVGIVEPSGRMRTPAELAGALPARLLDAVREPPGVGRAVRLAGSADRPVLLTAGDVRQLQLVKGSIYAGIRMLLDHAGLREDDLAEILIAGAFGNFVRKGSAQAIGLVPQVDPERVRFVGNAAGAGARLALVSADARSRAERLAARAEYIELANRADYHDAFVDAMAFPLPRTQEPA